MMIRFCGCYDIDYEFLVSNRKVCTKELKASLSIFLDKSSDYVNNKEDLEEAIKAIEKIDFNKGRAFIETEKKLFTLWMLWTTDKEPIILELLDPIASQLLINIDENFNLLTKEQKKLLNNLISVHYPNEPEQFKCPDDLVITKDNAVD